MKQFDRLSYICPVYDCYYLMFMVSLAIELIKVMFLFHCSQDTEGKILPTADANANNPIVTNIASQVVQKILR